MIRLVALSTLALGALAPAAFASCDISDTKCAVTGSKCNIHFKNVTAAGSGSDHGTHLSQQTQAQSVKVKALKQNGHTAGNVLTIDSGASKTMNLDKKAKKHFAKIRITSPGMASVQGVTMECDQVREVLNGNGSCKVFVGYPPYGDEYLDYQLGYKCDGGNVVGPKGED